MSDEEIQGRLHKLHADIEVTIKAALDRAGAEQSDIQSTIVKFRQENQQMRAFLGEEGTDEVCSR